MAMFTRAVTTVLAMPSRESAEAGSREGRVAASWCSLRAIAGWSLSGPDRARLSMFAGRLSTKCLSWS